jgi:hypothetical protein
MHLRFLAIASLMLICGTTSAAARTTVTDAAGRTVRLSDWAEDRLLAVVFLGVDCPLARLYVPELNRLHEEFAGRGVAFLGVFSNSHETRGQVAEFARELEFPAICDPTQAWASDLCATRTPEVVLLDAWRDVIYRGRIDDRYAVGVHLRAQPSRHDLREAIAESLRGARVSVPRTELAGCLIDRQSTEQAIEGGEVTYAEHIAPIFDAHCVSCHRAGEVGPMTLDTYDQAFAWRETIREVIESRRMPPWSARGGHFANNPSLSSKDRDLVIRWLDVGAPEGDPDKRPALPKFPSGWSISPTVTFRAPEFQVPAEGVLDYQEFVIDPGFAKDTWVRAIEIRPGNRAVVHHASLLMKPKDARPGMFYYDEMFDAYLALYVPGNTSTRLPPGTAKRIPAGWNLVLSVHYVPNGSPQADRSQIALELCNEPQVQIATRMVSRPIELAPGEVKTAIAETTLDADYLLIALYPHMHLRGRSMRLEAIAPGGAAETLLDVPDYDFEWQHRYVLARPRVLTAGTRLRCTAVYDNSAANPRNPDPMAHVKYGPATTDEMFFGAFELGRPVKHRKTTWPALAVVALAGTWTIGRRVRRR